MSSKEGHATSAHAVYLAVLSLPVGFGGAALTAGLTECTELDALHAAAFILLALCTGLCTLSAAHTLWSCAALHVSPAPSPTHAWWGGELSPVTQHQDRAITVHINAVKTHREDVIVKKITSAVTQVWNALAFLIPVALVCGGALSAITDWHTFVHLQGEELATACGAWLALFVGFTSLLTSLALVLAEIGMYECGMPGKWHDPTFHVSEWVFVPVPLLHDCAKLSQLVHHGFSSLHGALVTSLTPKNAPPMTF